MQPVKLMRNFVNYDPIVFFRKYSMVSIGSHKDSEKGMSLCAEQQSNWGKMLFKVYYGYWIVL